MDPTPYRLLNSSLALSRNLIVLITANENSKLSLVLKIVGVKRWKSILEIRGRKIVQIVVRLVRLVVKFLNPSPKQFLYRKYILTFNFFLV